MIQWILENTTTFIALLVGVALWTSIFTDYIKDYLARFNPSTIVLVVATIATTLGYWIGISYLAIPFAWYELVLAIATGVFTAYVAEKGYTALVQKFEQLKDGEPNEEEDGE